MSDQGDDHAGKKPSLIDRLAGAGERKGPRNKDKTVYFSSNLFSASMMVDATRPDADEPPADDDENEAQP